MSNLSKMVKSIFHIHDWFIIQEITKLDLFNDVFNVLTEDEKELLIKSNSRHKYLSVVWNSRRIGGGLEKVTDKVCLKCEKRKNDISLWRFIFKLEIKTKIEKERKRMRRADEILEKGRNRNA